LNHSTRTDSGFSRLKPVNTSLIAAWTILLFLRTQDSISRFPADPGYDLILQARQQKGIQAFSISDWPYFYVIPRAFIDFVTIWPMKFEAVILGSVINFVWIGSAFVIFKTVFSQTRNLVLSAISGTLLVLSPVAMESSLVSYGNVKWPLTVALACVFCAPLILRKRFKTVLLAVFLIGMSTPMVIFCVFPIGYWVARKEISRTMAIAIFVLISITTFMQIFASGGFSRAAQGWSDSRMFSLDGLGLFWLYGQLGPLMISIATAIIVLAKRIKGEPASSFSLCLTVTSVCILGTSFYLGGIADRYFVAPLVLSSIGFVAILWTKPMLDRFSIKKVLLAGFFVASLIPTIKWFESGWYLTSGPTWSAEVEKARDFCQNGSARKAVLRISPSGEAEVDCSLIID
jgi:hypothetical protein